MAEIKESVKVSRQKLLFICTANISRSRTAEDILKNSSKYDVQSAGVEWHARGGQMVSQGLINWADRIFVMEVRHLEHLYNCFCMEGKDKAVVFLDIPDNYGRGNPELIKLLISKLAEFGVVIS